jgi:hypothetical protein
VMPHGYIDRLQRVILHGAGRVAEDGQAGRSLVRRPHSEAEVVELGT